MRGYEKVIQEAELMAMSPDTVAEFLKRRGGQSKGDVWSDPIDESVEMALRARGNILIDIALARYGRHIEAVTSLFQSSAQDSPIRLACLANRSLGRQIFLSFPVGLFGREPQPMVEWLLSASDDELTALFTNPTLADSFLRDLLERREGWKAISDDRLCRIVSILTGNPRMRTPREDDYLDGYAEYSYSSVFNAGWKLAKTAPNTTAWAAALGLLYEQLQPDAFSIDEPLQLASRWRVDPSDAEEAEREAKDVAAGYLGHKQQVRKGLARLALHKDRKLVGQLLSSDDVAVRCAVYSTGALTVEQLRAAYERDGVLAYNEALHNLALWKRQGTREALHDIAWEVVRADEHSDMLAANVYNGVEKDFRNNHPEWFADDVDAQVPPDMPDQLSLKQKIEHQAISIEELGRAVRTLEAGAMLPDDQKHNTSLLGQIEHQAISIEELGRAVRTLEAGALLPDDQNHNTSLLGQIERQARSIEDVGKILRALMRRTAWVSWFSFGALVASAVALLSIY